MVQIYSKRWVIICSRCSTPGHSATWCNRPPKCKVCSSKHVTNDCPLIIAKREAKLSVIDKSHLKCPLCNGQHTATFRLCQGRQKYKENKLARQQQKTTNYINAPQPTRNPWTMASHHFPTLSGQHQQIYEPQQQQQQQQYQPVFNRPEYSNNIPQNNNQTHNNQQSTKFNSTELFAIFNQMIDIVQKCHNKGDQLKALSEIISQHLI